MNWLDYTSFDDFVLKTGLTPDRARETLLAECRRRGLL